MTEEKKKEFLDKLDNIKTYEDYCVVRNQIKIIDPFILFGLPDATMNPHLSEGRSKYREEIELVKYAIENRASSDEKQKTKKENINTKRIFISHASKDSELGKEFLKALVKIGIDKNDIFYSSQYHTGVELGEDFHKVIKDTLKNCNIVIFLLTKNFYKSAHCLNEMGAAWIENKKIVPILLDGLKHTDMVGFIDYHYIAMTPNISESKNLGTKFSPYIKVKTANPEVAFEDFINANNKSIKPLEIVDETKLNKNIKTKSIDDIIQEEDFDEIEGLMYKYLLDTYTNTLGERWLAKETIKDIQDWERNKFLNSKLSANYNTALKILKFRDVLDIEETTSYGNPRLYKIKDDYLFQLKNINKESKRILNTIIDNNPPF